MALPLIKLALAAGAGYFLYNKYRKTRAPGSPTNASDAVDDQRGRCRQSQQTTGQQRLVEGGGRVRVRPHPGREDHQIGGHEEIDEGAEGGDPPQRHRREEPPHGRVHSATTSSR